MPRWEADAREHAGHFVAVFFQQHARIGTLKIEPAEMMSELRKG
jgi:hypothetical protein